MPNLKLAFRTLFKSPFITLVAILSLALGIGANSAIFSLFDQMLLRPLPVPNPDELVNLATPGPKPGSNSCGQAGSCDEIFSYPMFRDLEREQTSFTGLAAHRNFGASVGYDGTTLGEDGLLVSGSYFPVLGLTPALGRLFTPEDDKTIGGHMVVVLSYDYWRNRFDLNPKTLGAYDGLLIYSNEQAIAPEQEKALLEYVRGGRGLIPIHCASYCFHNSPQYIRLVGGQFQKHKTGTFKTRTVDATHPLMKGLAPFETFDETYVHTKLGADIHLLQVRPESGPGRGSAPKATAASVTPRTATTSVRGARPDSRICSSAASAGPRAPTPHPHSKGRSWSARIPMRSHSST